MVPPPTALLDAPHGHTSLEPSEVWEERPWSCVRVYGYKTLYRATLGGVGRRGKAAEGQPQWPGRHPSSFSSVHGGPTVTRPWAVALNQRQAGPRPAFQGVKPLSKNCTAPPAVQGGGRARRRLWEHGRPLRRDGGGGAAGQCVGKGWVEEAPAGSGVRAPGPCQPPRARKRTSLSLSGLHFPHL